MFHDYTVIGYTQTGTLIRIGCGIVVLLPFNLTTHWEVCDEA